MGLKANLYVTTIEKRALFEDDANQLRNKAFAVKLHISSARPEMFAVVVGDAMLSYDGACLTMTEVCFERSYDAGIIVSIVTRSLVIDSECGEIVPNEILRSWLRKDEPGKKFARLFPHCMP